MIWTMLVLPVALMTIGAPIFTVLMVSASVAMIFVLDLPIGLLQTELFGGINNYNLIAVPFFILAGTIMTAGGISERLVAAVLAMLGGIRGGLGVTAVGASTVFGAISGSSPATVAAVGSMLFPSLREKGYPAGFASGLIATSGAIAGIIPPSIAMILYSVAAEESVRDLFIGGIIPGLLISLFMAIYILIAVRRMGIVEGGRFSIYRIVTTTARASWGLGMPIIILGGIYTGVFSPTEASGIACLYSIIVTRFIYRSLSFADLWKATTDSVTLTAQVLIVVGAATIFSRMLTIAGVPQDLVMWIQGLGLSSFSLMLILNVFMLLVGCVLDPVSAILVLAPILKPIIVSAGIDPVHFGVVMTVNLMIGMFTPPFGLNIFIAQAVFKVPLATLYRGIAPFAAVNIFTLAVVSFWPALTLSLVHLFR